MFITFGMFIGLIILTIIMIALIIYLTFTGGNRPDKKHQAEEEAKERLSQHLNTRNHDQAQQASDNSTHSYHSSTNHSDEIDDSFNVLPYPKDEDFK